MQILSIATFSCALCVFTTSVAFALEFCIICNEPTEKYICQLNSGVNATGKNKSFLRQSCTSKVIETYEHGKCKAHPGNYNKCRGSIVSIDTTYLNKQSIKKRLARPKIKNKNAFKGIGNDVKSGTKKFWQCVKSEFKNC